MLILFDDSTITAAHIKTTRDSAEKFVKEHMRTSETVRHCLVRSFVAHPSRIYRRPEKILAAIRLLRSVGQRAPRFHNGYRFSGSASAVLGRRQQQWRRALPIPYARYQSESFFRALDALSRSVERVRGRKSILLFSEDLPLSDESRSLYLKTLNSARKANVVFYAIDAKGTGIGGCHWRDP